MKEENYDLKRAIISGASHALKYRDKHPRATEQEIMQHISDESDSIIEKMNSEE